MEPTVIIFPGIEVLLFATLRQNISLDSAGTHKWQQNCDRRYAYPLVNHKYAQLLVITKILMRLLEPLQRTHRPTVWHDIPWHGWRLVLKSIKSSAGPASWGSYDYRRRLFANFDLVLDQGHLCCQEFPSRTGLGTGIPEGSNGKFFIGAHVQGYQQIPVGSFLVLTPDNVSHRFGKLGAFSENRKVAIVYVLAKKYTELMIASINSVYQLYDASLWTI